MFSELLDSLRHPFSSGKVWPSENVDLMAVKQSPIEIFWRDECVDVVANLR